MSWNMPPTVCWAVWSCFLETQIRETLELTRLRDTKCSIALTMNLNFVSFHISPKFRIQYFQEKKINIQNTQLQSPSPSSTPQQQQLAAMTFTLGGVFKTTTCRIPAPWGGMNPLQAQPVQPTLGLYNPWGPTTASLKLTAKNSPVKNGANSFLPPF